LSASDGGAPPLLPLTVDEVDCGVIGGKPQLLGHRLDALCGSTPKTMSSEIGDFGLDTPRDRDGSFEPRLGS